MFLFPWLPDPRPCPVDDAPHTTCVSPDYDPSKYPAAQVVVPIRRPFVLDETLAAMATRVVVPPDPPTFTTATYRRRRKKGLP